MANIQISKLLPAGYELFDDAAGFLDELATQELQSVVGGGHHSCHYHHKHKSHSGSYNNYSNYKSQSWW
ncbi:hypothetical protein [Anabaena catenula]|uniref:Uncharacterized protein n=1 Tax=Anabaena catenula FACHB-362 TaxID=2692877 RepID=A0ABR8J4C9_9NOST|nr:hypothetical protein [Anabaena catenula]MBD2692460.1 hypothetical protein [Anabaena catenula FACHB-362]